MHRISRRGVQDLCRPVLGVPISLGAIQRLIDRTSLAIVPHDAAIARLARKARVGYVDETPWYCRHALQWLWTMVTDTVAVRLAAVEIAGEVDAQVVASPFPDHYGIADGADSLVDGGCGSGPVGVVERGPARMRSKASSRVPRRASRPQWGYPIRRGPDLQGATWYSFRSVGA